MEQETKLSDKWLVCVECGSDFAFEIGEQRFYKTNGLLSPKRCPSCRKAKRLLMGGA